MGDTCPQCGGEYKDISTHWSMSSSCDHPPLTQHQKEMVTGILMGDGYIDRGAKNPSIEINMISPNYLEYVARQFGVLGGDVKLKKTAEQSANHARDTNFSRNADVDNYSDVYRWRSISHPELERFGDWYSTGKKVWPKDIELTPTVLKHWYCGDGCWANKNYQNYIRISMSNEIENLEKVDSLFENVGLPSPNNYNIAERSKNGGKTCSATFTTDQSKELWEYMGEPLPDFEYKWPDRYC